MNVPLFDESDATPWRDDELATVWRHQLSARLEPELAEWDADLLRRLRNDPAAAAKIGDTVAAILHATDTPRPVLMALKSLGKAMNQDRTRGIPHDIGKLLYFAAIAAALARGERISELNQPTLKQGLTFAVEQTWLDPSTLQLLRNALATLR